MSAAPSFPPLFRGREAGDPLGEARRLAAEGCDGGTVLYHLADGDLAAATIFAPDVPLARAAEMIPVAAIGLRDALGALAPPEVAIRLDWDGAIRVNGGIAGLLGCHAATRDPAAVPDWLIITLRVDFLPASDDAGDTPERTALHAEGCGEVTPAALLEAWTRHTLLWINQWMDGERRVLFRQYTGLVHGLGAHAVFTGQSGEFTGVDEDFSALLQGLGGTTAVPLHAQVQP